MSQDLSPSATAQGALIAILVGLAPVVVKALSIIFPALATRVQVWSDKRRIEVDAVKRMGAELQRVWDRLDTEREAWATERARLHHEIELLKAELLEWRQTTLHLQRQIDHISSARLLPADDDKE